MDFDDETFEDEDATDERPNPPDYRVTVQRSGAVRLVPWVPWLQSSGPAYTLMAARDRAGIMIADLRVIRDDEGTAQEVIVDSHSGGSDTHRAALCDWAQAVGYRRVWFDDEVIDLAPSAGGTVTTRCTGCDQRFVEGRNVHFWDYVRRAGAFPLTCSLCGSDLPQWTSAGLADIGGAKRPTLTHDRPAPRGKRAHRG